MRFRGAEGDPAGEGGTNGGDAAGAESNDEEDEVRIGAVSDAEGHVEDGGMDKEEDGGDPTSGNDAKDGTDDKDE